MPKPPKEHVPAGQVAPPKDRTFAFAVLKEADGTYRPVRLEIQGHTVLGHTKVGEPGPYMSIAYEILASAVQEEYLRHTMRLGGT